MKKKSVKYIVAAILLCAIIWGGYMTLSPYFLLGGIFDNNYENEDLEANYKKNELEIYELKIYFESILPENKGATFGFDKRNDRFFLIIREIKEKGRIEFTTGKDLQIGSEEMKNLLDLIGWTTGKVEVLVSKLQKANCISGFKQPYKRKPVKIAYRNGGPLGMAVFSYFLFDKPLTDSTRRIWEKKEGFRVYNDSVLFEYGYPL